MLGIELGPVGQAGQRLRGERLVELDHVDVAPAQAGALQRLVGGLDGGDAEDVWVDGVHGARDDPRQRLAPEALGRGRVADQRRAGAVVERGGVAGGDRAVLAEGGPQLGELLHRRVGPDALVARQLDVGQRDHVVVVEAGLPGGVRALVALDGERVLLLARDLVAVGEDLGRLAQGDRPLLGHVRVDHPPPERRGVQRLVAGGEALGRLEQHPRCAAHRLHPADHGQRGVAGLDRAAGLDRRLQAAAAQAVDGHARHGGGQAGQQDGHARDVAVLLAGAVGVAEEDVVDQVGVDVGSGRPRGGRRARPGRRGARRDSAPP